MTTALSERVTQSERNAIWVQDRIDGLAVSSVSTGARQQWAVACWAAVIEHHHAIVLLTRAGRYSSARALLRPLFEAYIRGVWLNVGATDHDVDVVRQDRFPTFARMIDTIQATEKVRGDRLSELKAAWWGPMCSLTHTGFLTPKDVGRPEPTGMIDALAWADWTVIQALRGFGLAAGDSGLVRAADERVGAVYRDDAAAATRAVAPVASVP